MFAWCKNGDWALGGRDWWAATYESELEDVAPFPVLACHLGTLEGWDRLYVIPLFVMLLLSYFPRDVNIDLEVPAYSHRPRPHLHHVDSIA